MTTVLCLPGVEVWLISSVVSNELLIYSKLVLKMMALPSRIVAKLGISPGQSVARRAVEGCFPAVLGMCGSGAGPAVSQGRECLRALAWRKGGDVHGGRGGRIGSMVSHTAV